MNTAPTPTPSSTRRRPVVSLRGGPVLAVGIGVLVLIGLGLYLAGGTGTTKSVAPVPSSVTAKLGEMYVRLDHRTVRAGNVRFTVHNTGAVMHELIVLRTGTRAANLPTESSGRASEQASIGELADVAAGTSATKVFRLAAGHYALICNLPGHYRAGMIADLTVK